METIGMQGGTMIKGFRGQTPGNTGSATGTGSGTTDPWYSGDNAAGWGTGIGAILDAILNRGGNGTTPTPGGSAGGPVPQQNNTLMYAIVALVVVVVLVLIIFLFRGGKR